MATTLQQLRVRTRYFIDEMEDTTPVTWTNAELNQYLNDEQRWLWVYLSKQDDSFGLRESTMTTVDGQANYVYPSDILGNSIRALYAYVTGDSPQHKVKRGSIEEVAEQGIYRSNPPEKYACLDGYFQVGPPSNDAGYTLRIYYNRAPTQMTTDGSNMESDDDYAEQIAMGAAVRALRRIGRDTQAIEVKRQELLQEAARSNSADDLMQVSPAWKY
jgi:hypothetical protein